MTGSELRRKYLEFFKARGHAEISGRSLIPENDPTVLFTTAGMHPLVPYILGEPHPAGRRLVDVQKCIRTGDIDDVGDPSHLTFFEMLGNWSLGDYFKDQAIRYSYEFLTSKEWLGFSPDVLHVTVFAGDAEVPADDLPARLGQADLDIQDDEGVNFKQAWADPKTGHVFCLSEAPSAEAVRKIHERAGHPADEIHEIMRALKLGAGEYDWDGFGKGGLYLILFVEYGFLYVFWRLTGHVGSANDFALQYLQDPTAFYLLGRVTVALMGAGTCLVIYWIGKRLYGWRTGLVAAFLGATAYFHAAWSHYINVDTGMTLAVWASLLAYLKYEETDQSKWLAASGALNRSAQHVDIVADFRPGGCGREVRVDGLRLAPRNGLWEVAG